MKKNYALVFVVFLCFVLSGYGQVNEDFDTFINGSYGNHSYNNFEINNGLGELANSRSGRAVRLRDFGTSNLEYVGTDGNGKDGGIGVVSFWYRSWDSSPDAKYDVQVSISGSPYTNIGTQIVTNSTTYTKWSHSLNSSSDNIKVRVIKVNGERLIIDDFNITNYSPTGPTITVTQATGGTISPGTASYTSGADQSFTATPDACHTFSNWLIDGSTTSTANPYTFTNITANHSITAVYNSYNYNITATSGPNGGVTPNGITSVDCGTDQTYTIIPDSGYAIDDVLVDGVSVGAVTSHTFTNVTTTHTISASFVAYVEPCFSMYGKDFPNTSGFTENNGNAKKLASGGTDGSISTNALSGVSGDVTVQFNARGWNSSEIQVTVTLNGVSQFFNTIADGSYSVYSASFTSVPINSVLEFSTISGKRVFIELVELYCTAPCIPPSDPTGTVSGTTSACDNTTLSYSGTPPAGTVNYWQTTATGTTTTDNAASPLNVTSSGTYYVRAQDTASSCWSDGTVSQSVTINVPPSISSQPADASRTIPNTATFSVTTTSTPAASYQWQVSTNGGSSWTNVSGGSGGTTSSYTTSATSEAMHNNQYRCVVTNTCGSVNSAAATLSLTNPKPTNVSASKGCFLDNSVELSWDAPTSNPTPTGYVVFARAGATSPTGTKTDANTYTANSDYSLATPVTPTSLGRVVYKGSATNATITGLTENSNYSFTIYAYVSESLTGWANGATGGSTVNNGLAQYDVRNLTATPLTNKVTLNWSNPLPSSCWDEILVVANEGTFAFTPSGDGSTYSANPVYSGANSIVYKASSNTVAVTGLTNSINYCFKVFIRRGTTWTVGEEVCAVPSLSYCSASGTTSFNTGITGVTFNTINTSGTPSNPAYTDYTAMSTTVVLGGNYNLGVVINIDGAVEMFTKVWIDWNQDGVFNVANEEYDLGMDENTNSSVPLNTATSNSPINVEIPSSAVLGATRMRVFAQYSHYPTPCEDEVGGEVEDYTIVVEQPTGAEINIKGANISIHNGSNAPYGLNNTLFAQTPVGGTTAPKEYSIQNLGLTNLNLTGTPKVEITGLNASDFTVILQPSATIGSSSNSAFRIQFSPSADGVRNATVKILNNDSDENPYEFAIRGTGFCSSSIPSAIWPVEGPENTEVTITSSNDLTGASATLNGIAMPIISASDTELVVSVPLGASTGNLNILFATGCSSIQPFEVINKVIGGCETTSSSVIPADLFISELSDASTGSSSVIEIYNGTSSPIILTEKYSIKIYNNGSTTASNTIDLLGTIASDAVHVVAIGTTSCDLSSLGTPDQVFTGIGGINFEFNGSDMVALYKNSSASIIDAFGVFESNSWANGLVDDGDGADFKRKNDASPLPNNGIFDLNDFNLIEWEDCGNSDYSDFGSYDFSLGIPPLVSVLNTPLTNCTNPVQLSISATEGAPGGTGITYTWYYLIPGDPSFLKVPDNVDFDNVTSETLIILNPFAYSGYQFYCQVLENSETCFSASNAVTLKFETATWDGISWSNLPTGNMLTVLDANYNTGNGSNGQTSFEACQLLINTGIELTIANDTYVQVKSNLIVDGSIVVKPYGSFVQINDDATVTGNNITVEKRTAPLASYREYTYWSSPVFGETINNGLSEASSTRRYKFDAKNYLDATMEVANDNSQVPGQDGIDDDGNDWVQVAGGDIMEAGVGYAATHSSSGFTPGQFIYTFVGPFNNGIIEVPIYRNDQVTLDDNWNFIGNPYPSAIDADAFLSQNSGLEQDIGTTTGAIFFWSHNTPATASTNGNQVLNYSQADYAIINGSGNVAGGDGLKPTRHIPSGQGFFVAMSNSASATVVSGTGGDIETTDVIFNNAMRVPGNNSQFFRADGANVPNKIHLNLTSDNGVFNQILVAYVENATNAFDGMYFDAPKNPAAEANATLYSLIDDGSNNQYAIQGKAPNSLDLDEVIPLGFYTSIAVPTIYSISIAQLQGDFMNEHTIYIYDRLLNNIYSLSASAYHFTSEAGTFNNRFEIVFTTETLSTSKRIITSEAVSIIELKDGRVQFSVGIHLTLRKVEIYDLLGRRLYQLKANASTELYELSNLSQSAYFAKVTLSNGQVVSKTAIKQH